MAENQLVGELSILQLFEQNPIIFFFKTTLDGHYSFDLYFKKICYYILD